LAGSSFDRGTEYSIKLPRAQVFDHSLNKMSLVRSF